MQSTMNVQPRPQSTNTQAEVTPMMNSSDKKRKDAKAKDTSLAAKKMRSSAAAQKVPSLGIVFSLVLTQNVRVIYLLYAIILID